MDISSINSNINSLNNIPNQQIGKSNSTSQINNNDDEFLKLSINDYNRQRDELSSSLQAFNEGIGISLTAQKGLEKQEYILKKIEDILIKVQDEQSFIENKNEVKNSINKELLNFKEEAFQTKYQNENLLVIEQYEDELAINIRTKDSYFSVDKPNTPQIALELLQTINSNNFNNPEELENTINTLQTAQEQLQDFQTQFSNLETNLEISAKETIKKQIDISRQNQANNEINFGKESNDFSKTNIQANLGYLAASQANIIQEQSVRLLS